MGQQRLIEDLTSREADIPDNKSRRREQPVTLPDKVKKKRPGDAHESEESQELLLRAQVVRHSAEYRRGQRDRPRHRVRVSPVSSTQVPRKAGRGHFVVVHRQNRRHDARHKGGVRPVIHGPGAQFATVEPKGRKTRLRGDGGVGHRDSRPAASDRQVRSVRTRSMPDCPKMMCSCARSGSPQSLRTASRALLRRRIAS